MELIKFSDTCTIERVTGYDEYSNCEIAKVYDGQCLYEENSVFVSQGVIVHRATLYIQGRVDMLMNDLVRITDVNGTNISAVAGDVDIVKMPISGEIITKVELKQGVV